MTKALQRYDGALVEMYAGQPEEMNALRRAQKMLEPLAKRAGSAAAGGPATTGHKSAWKLLEIALKAHYGIVKGGGVLRTVRLAAGLGADDAVAAQRIVTRMMLDPELAAHLLTRKVHDVGSPAWIEKLAKLLRRVQVGREVFGDEDSLDRRDLAAGSHANAGAPWRWARNV